jgi:hypothetical protein
MVEVAHGGVASMAQEKVREKGGEVAVRGGDGSRGLA